MSENVAGIVFGAAVYPHDPALDIPSIENSARGFIDYLKETFHGIAVLNIFNKEIKKEITPPPAIASSQGSSYFPVFPNKAYRPLPHKICGLEHILVMIVKKETGEPAGWGFYYKGDSIIICAGVVKSAAGKDNSVHFYFPFLQDRNMIRRIISAKHYKNEEGCFYDIAVITIERKVPARAQAVELTYMDNYTGKTFFCYHSPGGQDASGEILQETKNGLFAITQGQEPDSPAYQNLTGAPVWDKNTEAVLGILVQPDQTADTHFMLSSSSLMTLLHPEKDYTHLPQTTLLYNIPSLPDGCIQRNRTVEKIKLLLGSNELNTITGITGKSQSLGIHGMGGIGKTVVAAMIAHDPDVQKMFPDGIVWITLGQKPNMAALLNIIRNAFRLPVPEITTLYNGKLLLHNELEGKRFLLILDTLRGSKIERIVSYFTEDYQYHDIFHALAASLKCIDDKTLQEWYLDCAVFAEDAVIPASVFPILWTGLKADDVTYYLQQLTNRSLLFKDEKNNTFRLHDLQRDFCVRMTKQNHTYKKRHAALVENYRMICHGKWADGPREGYYFKYLIYHIAESENRGLLETLLFSLPWMYAKLENEGINDLIVDYEYLKTENTGDVQTMIDVLTKSSHILRIDPKQLPSQLLGRLIGFKSKKIQHVLHSAKQWKKFTWLRPRMLCLDPPGSPLKKTLTGHTDDVESVSFSPDGRCLASGSYDKTIKLWKVESGEEIASFCADSPIFSVAVNKENQIAAGGYGTLFFLDVIFV